MTARALTRLDLGAAVPKHPTAPVDVVAMPHSGAAATAFRDLACRLAGSAIVHGVTLPGRGARSAEALPTDWDVEVHALTDEIARTLDPARPLVLVGQSLGAILAFEVARRLRADGRAVAHLIVAGRSAPHLGGPLSLPAEDGELATVVAARFGSIPEAVLAEPDLLAYFVPVLRADLVFNGYYRPMPGGPVDVPTTALLGAEDRTIPVAAARGWQEHTSAAFDLRVVPGGHLCLTGNEGIVASRVAAATAHPSAA